MKLLQQLYVNSVTMRHMAFQRNNTSYGGGKDRGNNKRGYGNSPKSGYKREGGAMHKTTCSNCGKDCEVPFRPTGEKPVYCSDCFRTMSANNDKRSDAPFTRKPSFDRDRSSSSDRSSRFPAMPHNREQFEQLNVKLDKIIRLLGGDITKKPTKEVQAEQ